MERNRDSGENSLAFFAFFDPGSSSWRMSQRSLFPDEVSTSFSETWPRSGSMRSGHVSERLPLEPLISGTDSSSSAGWPTPLATDHKNPAMACQAKRNSPQISTAAAILANAIGLISWSTNGPPDMTTSTDGDDGPGSVYAHPSFVEALMGFPEGWTSVLDCEL